MTPDFSNLEALKTKGSTSPVDANSLPGILPTAVKNALDVDKLHMRYQKLDMDQAGDISELQSIETKAIRNQGVYVLSKKEFTFMDRIFILIQYLEQDN